MQCVLSFAATLSPGSRNSESEETANARTIAATLLFAKALLCDSVAQLYTAPIQNFLCSCCIYFSLHLAFAFATPYRFDLTLRISCTNFATVNPQPFILLLRAFATLFEVSCQHLHLFQLKIEQFAAICIGTWKTVYSLC